MKRLLFLLTVVIQSSLLTQIGWGQDLTISDGSGAQLINLPSTDFTTSDGISTLDPWGSGYTTNVTSDLSTLLPNASANVISTLANGSTGAGWVFQTSDGIVVITNNGNAPQSTSPVALGDPFVAYNYSFYNSSGTTQPFTMTFTSTFSPTTFSSSEVRGTFGLSLTDGTANETGASIMDTTQTATLSLAGTNTTSAGADLTIPGYSVGGGDTVPASQKTPNYGAYITGPSGTFDTLTVTVSGTYTSGAEIGVTGRVDVIDASEVPEPATWVMMLGGVALLGFCVHRRLA